jgi:GT2 family glycosyltransferase
MTLPAATIVTVTYNSARDLQRFAARPPEDIEWIVIDNASSDDSALVAQELGATVVKLERNIGFGAANNVGFKHARGKFIGVVNPDVTVNYADIPHLIEMLSAEDAIVAPQLLNLDGTEQPNGRGYPTIPNKILNRIAPARAEARGFQVIAYPEEVREPVTVIGAAFFTTMSVLDSLGGFDERFFVYYEDIDLCLRAKALGIPRYVVGRVRWTHGWARAASGLNLRGWALELNGLLRFYSRYPRLLILEDKADRMVRHDQ